MTKGLKIRAILAAGVLAGCACAVALTMTADRGSAKSAPESTAAVNASVGAAKKASSDDLARRYRRVVRRRTVVI